MPKLRDCQRTGLASSMVVVLLFLSSGCTTTPTVKQVCCSDDSKTVAGVGSASTWRFPIGSTKATRLSCPASGGAARRLRNRRGPARRRRALGDRIVRLDRWMLRLIHNLRAIDHNQREAHKIAAKIVAYQDRYPGRPVHLVGYSGGAGVAVLTLEALPPDRRVAEAISAPTLASDYDLRPASATRRTASAISIRRWTCRS